MISFFMVSMMLSMLLISVNSLLSVKIYKEREKLSAFECGFDPKSMTRLPFSLHFFLVALIFLIFDVEITLILPFPMMMEKAYSCLTLYVFLFFMLILIVGVAMEWWQGALDWSK